MRQITFAAGVAALTMSMPALADTRTTLYPNFAPSTATIPGVVAQSYPVPPPPYPQTPPAYPSPAYPSPAYPSADTPLAPPSESSAAAFAPSPPPPPEVETPPPTPSPTYVWESGHWYWNGLQYHWQAGKYVAKPAATATFKPGHWEQRPEGWVWVNSEWSYRTQGTGE
jgi:hypothetical protein